MKKTFEIFTQDKYTDFIELVNMLNRYKRKFTITKHGDNGFCVWYYM